MILNKVGVGRSFVLDESAGPSIELPDGYDSFYLHSDSSMYAHEYMLMDPAQALPQYIVHFTLDESMTMPPISATDMASRKRHFREHMAGVKDRVLDALSQLGPAAGDQTELLLAEIAEKYEQALTASCTEDPLLQERKRAISKAVSSIAAKVEVVQSNHKAVEDAIYDRMQQVLQQLNKSTEGKIATLLAEELELRRQKQQIEWTEGFVGVLADTLPPMSFISAWDKHQAMRSTLYHQAAHSPAIGASSAAVQAVEADLKLVGHLEVLSEAQAAGAGRSSPHGSPHHTHTSATQQFSPFSTSSPQHQHPSPTLYSHTPVAAHSPVPPPMAPPVTTLQAAPAPRSRQEAEAALAAAQQDLAATSQLAATLPAGQTALAHSMLSTASARLQQAQVQHATFVQTEAFSALERTGTPVSPRAPDAGGAGRHQPPAPPAALVHAMPAANNVADAALASPSRQLVTRDVKDLLERHSLSKYVESRRRGLSAEVLQSITPDRAFADSKVLTSADAAMRVFLCLPFEQSSYGGGTSAPSTQRIFNSEEAYPPGMGEFPAVYSQWVASNGPPAGTVVLVKAAGHVFGGYAASEWRFDGTFHGSPKNFLFSLTRDAKLPYTGRAKGPQQDADKIMRSQHEEENIRIQINYEQERQAEIERLSYEGVVFDDVGNVMRNPRGADTSKLDVPPPRKRPWFRVDAQRSTPDMLQFGVGDLVLAGDLSECTCHTEASYGVGLSRDSVEAKAFFGGSTDGVFRADVVEVWAVQHEFGGYGNYAAGVEEGYDAGYDDGY